MNIVIIGNGISGITAARHIRKLSNHSITVISEETDYFFSRTALMYVYMGHQRFVDTQPYENWFWAKNRIELRKGRVESIDYQQKTLIFNDKQILNYDKLIIAVGSKPNKFGSCVGSDMFATTDASTGLELFSITLYKYVLPGNTVLSS